MNATQPAPINLSLVSISDLPERTKDFLIARSALGKPVAEVLREILNEEAARSGFQPQPTQP